LGERRNRTAEVRGSNPLGSTSLRCFAASAGKPAFGLSSEAAKAARHSPQGDGGSRRFSSSGRGFGWQASRRAKGEGGPDRLSGPMKYVYLIESIDHPEEIYIGLTDDLRTRFAAHNAGQSSHTAKFKPWRLVTYIAFSDEEGDII
jgi:putative endonuclease